MKRGGYSAFSRRFFYVIVVLANIVSGRQLQNIMSGKVLVQELDAPSQDLIRTLFKGITYARFGDVGYNMTVHYKDDVDDIKNMPVRPDDIWVITFPRSGTTRTQQLVWLLKNNLDYEAALRTPLTDRYLQILSSQLKRDQIQHTQKYTKEGVFNAPSPRFIKTHTPLSLLPVNLLDTTKVVYVARDPRDVVVSWYHHNKLFLNYEGDLKTFWNLFRNNLSLFTPYFPHVKEAWVLRHHPNMLFIFYEDMSRDLPASIKRIANFLSKEVSNEQIVGLCNHLDINNFRNNKSVNRSWLEEEVNHITERFVRKGRVGGWREYFDAEMSAQAQAWMRENLAGTDLRFPDHS